MEFLADPQVWIALLTLTVLELVLGIDNIIFISILAGKLPPEQQSKARFIGLTGALVMRVILLFSLSWIIGLTEPLFSVFWRGVSGSARRRTVFNRQKHARNSRLARRRGRTRSEKGLRFVRQRHHSDYAARHRFLARFRDYGNRNG
jgi:predicted tellurium resistance membrane protein TerC